MCKYLWVQKFVNVVFAHPEFILQWERGYSEVVVNYITSNFKNNDTTFGQYGGG